VHHADLKSQAKLFTYLLFLLCLQHFHLHLQGTNRDNMNTSRKSSSEILRKGHTQPIKKFRVVKLRKVSSVKLLPAEAPLLSQPPLNIAANPLKRLSTELDRTGASWLQVMPQRRGESLVTDTAACWRVKEQGSLVIPLRSPCDVLVIPW
jgi:hypothetical protein